MSESPYPPFAGVEPYDTVRSIEDERAHRKRMCALGYRIFARDAVGAARRRPRVGPRP